MTAARCKCSHVRSQHFVSRSGAALCADPCGCREFRPDDGQRWTPAHDLDEPRRVDMGSLHVDTWPEKWEVTE